MVPILKYMHALTIAAVSGYIKQLCITYCICILVCHHNSPCKHLHTFEN